MGLVYDPERVGAGEIPAYADGQAQYDAAVVLGESMSELVRQIKPGQTEILAYMLYGSASRAWKYDANRRSDVDFLAILDTPTDSILPAIHERIQAVEATYKVSVNSTIYDREELEGPYRINPFYANHLRSVRSLVVGDTSQYFLPFKPWKPDVRSMAVGSIFASSDFVEAAPFAHEYIKVRRQHFQSRFDQTVPDLSALKGPFELPRNLGRTLCDLHNLYQKEYDEDAYDPIRDEWIGPINYRLSDEQNLLNLVDFAGLGGLIGDDLERLTELDEAYTKLLEETVSGEVSVAEYERWLRSIYNESLERAFKITDLAGGVVDRIIDLAKLHPDYDKVPGTHTEYYLMYPENHEYFVSKTEVGYRGTEVTPVSYDIDKLLFAIAPKYPDMARRYEQACLERQRLAERNRREQLEEYEQSKTY